MPYFQNEIGSNRANNIDIAKLWKKTYNYLLVENKEAYFYQNDKAVLIKLLMWNRTMLGLKEDIENGT